MLLPLSGICQSGKEIETTELGKYMYRMTVSMTHIAFLDESCFGQTFLISSQLAGIFAGKLVLDRGVRSCTSY
jgi:hypothetical protein